ncbi:MAG TPA: YHS domain-containing protein, partial [Gaiellaceae bacterium]
DPVCGMTVDRKAGKPTAVFGGRTYYFCGEHCKERFAAAPERYVAAAGRRGLSLGVRGQRG